MRLKLGIRMKKIEYELKMGKIDDVGAFKRTVDVVKKGTLIILPLFILIFILGALAII